MPKKCNQLLKQKLWKKQRGKSSFSWKKTKKLSHQQLLRSLCLTFWVPQNHFPQQLYHFVFLPDKYEGSDCSEPLTPPVTFLFLNSHPSGWKVASRCSFIFVSLVTSDAEYLFISSLQATWLHNTAHALNAAESCTLTGLSLCYVNFIRIKYKS